MSEAKKAMVAAEAVILQKGKVRVSVEAQPTPANASERHLARLIGTAMVRDYGYSERDIAFEVPFLLGAKEGRADIVIFYPGADHAQAAAQIIIECVTSRVKAVKGGSGRLRLRTLMAACPNVLYGMWTDGLKYACYRSVDSRAGNELIPIADLPRKGQRIEGIGGPEVSYEALDAINSHFESTGDPIVRSSL